MRPIEGPGCCGEHPAPPLVEPNEGEKQMAYTIAQLNELIRLAKKLGFGDDVAHWEAEKRRLEESR